MGDVGEIPSSAIISFKIGSFLIDSSSDFKLSSPDLEFFKPRRFNFWKTDISLKNLKNIPGDKLPLISSQGRGSDFPSQIKCCKNSLSSSRWKIYWIFERLPIIWKEFNSSRLLQTVPR